METDLGYRQRDRGGVSAMNRIWNACIYAVEGVVMGLAVVGFIYTLNLLLAWVDTL